MALTTIKTSQLRDGAEFLKRNGTVAMTGDLNLNTHKITGVVDPVNPQDAATKAYVDSVASGLDPKESVRAYSNSNIASLSGTTSIDSVSISAGERVLLNGQTNKAQNGLWVVQAGAWTRPTDFVTGKVSAGAFVFIEEGTSFSDTGWVLTTNGAITVGTTDLYFAQFSGAGTIEAGAGMTKTGNTLNVVTADSGRIVVNADNIDLATTGVSAGTYTKLTVDVYGRVTVGASATTTDIGEGTNLYFTNARAQGAMTGAISSVVTSNLDASKVVVSDASGKIAASTDITTTELNHLNNIDENIKAALTSIRAKSIVEANYKVREKPVEVPNGTITDFTLANIPYSGSEMVFLNGVLQNRDGSSDYSLSGTTISFTSPPDTDDVILVTYLKPNA